MSAFGTKRTFPDSLANFKQFVEDLPAGKIGCMSVILCRDSEKNGSLDLIEWLNSKYKEKDFSLTGTAVSNYHQLQKPSAKCGQW